MLDDCNAAHEMAKLWRRDPASACRALVAAPAFLPPLSDPSTPLSSTIRSVKARVPRARMTVRPAVAAAETEAAPEAEAAPAPAPEQQQQQRQRRQGRRQQQCKHSYKPGCAWIRVAHPP